MTHTAALRISEVTEADLGKEFTLNATNFYGVTTYTVTLDNIGGGCIARSINTGRVTLQVGEWVGVTLI